ncbi:MAG: prephenate dehydratase [Bacteroidota bacterium]|nr:prephenate dehydratase [Bacteroidota bacterium]
MNLNKLRKEIDHIDDHILSLLNQRMTIVKEIGEIKNLNKSIIYRPEREKSIIDRLSQHNPGLLNRKAIEAIYLEIFAVSRNMELPEKVVYLGPEGSFTHQAAESRFGAMSEYIPLGSISAVFETIATDRARFGVVPIENNQEGVVSETVDLLEKFDLKIVAEVPLSIHFAFATKSDDVTVIRKIYSKDIAFRQCKKFIDDMYGELQVELIPVNSTSKAVKIALVEKDSAAICSHIAAKMYNLPILFENVENSENNQTRFLIISRNFINQKSTKDKTTILAKLSDEPGSLVNFLQDFHKAGINLSKIESRPSKDDKSFKYWFLIDFDGHFEDENVKSVLERHKKNIKNLGSYVKLC